MANGYRAECVAERSSLIINNGWSSTVGVQATPDEHGVFSAVELRPATKATSPRLVTERSQMLAAVANCPISDRLEGARGLSCLVGCALVVRLRRCGRCGAALNTLDTLGSHLGVRTCE